MPSSFDISTESTASVDQIHAAFAREDYWLARIAAANTNAPTTLDSLIVDPDGTVMVRATQHVGRGLLPGPVAKFVPGDLKIVTCETWRSISNGEVRGQSSFSAAGGLASGLTETWLRPASKGSQLRYAVQVEVKVPLVGGKFEKAIGEGLAQSIPAVQQFTDEWIAEHG